MTSQPELFDTDIGTPWAKAFLRLDEAATFLNVSADTVERLIDCGELESISIAQNVAAASRQHRRVSNRSLTAFVNRRRKLAP